jgi:hypothetical protein
VFRTRGRTTSSGANDQNKPSPRESSAQWQDRTGINGNNRPSLDS